MTGINRILKHISVAVVVVAPVLFLSQLRSTDTWHEAVQGTWPGWWASCRKGWCC